MSKLLIEKAGMLSKAPLEKKSLVDPLLSKTVQRLLTSLNLDFRQATKQCGSRLILLKFYCLVDFEFIRQMEFLSKSDVMFLFRTL